METNMTEELKASIEKAREEVNAAIIPYGFKANRLLDEQIAADFGEAWFVIDSISETDKPHKDFFEVCYYLQDYSPQGPKKGSMAFGIQAADWIPLHNDPSVACGEFRDYNGE